MGRGLGICDGDGEFWGNGEGSVKAGAARWDRGRSQVMPLLHRLIQLLLGDDGQGRAVSTRPDHRRRRPDWILFGDVGWGSELSVSSGAHQPGCGGSEEARRKAFTAFFEHREN